jgi:hypothetical protein
MLRLATGGHRQVGHTQPIKIARGPGVAKELLLRRVAEGARRRGGEILAGAQRSLNAAEVDKRRLAARAQDDVLGIDVAVDDGRRAEVNEGQHLQDLAQPAPHLGLAEPRATRYLAQRRSRHQLHDQREASRLGERDVVEPARNARMLQAAQHRRLALEQLQGLPARQAVEAQHLDQDRRAVALAHAAVGDAEAAASVLGQQPVATTRAVQHPTDGKIYDAPPRAVCRARRIMNVIGVDGPSSHVPRGQRWAPAIASPSPGGRSYS